MGISEISPTQINEWSHIKAPAPAGRGSIRKEWTTMEPNTVKSSLFESQRALIPCSLFNAKLEFSVFSVWNSHHPTFELRF